MKVKDTTAKIVAVFNQKGGCAKTMSTMQLGGTLGEMGFDVFIIDMDPQNTAALWALQADAENPFPATVLSMAPLRENFIEKIGQHISKNHIILIDCPPSLESRVPWVSLLIADLAIIPVIPVLDNVWASRQAEELVQRARESRKEKNVSGELKAAYLLSATRRGKVFDMCQGILEEKAQIPILDTKIALRNVFPESQVYGCVAGSFGKNAGASDFNKLAKEVIALLDLEIPKGKGK